MELKVWVDGVVRVVCGVALNTSCQDVVIALAQAIGQTGRYVLIMKFRENERTLVPGDCPMERLAHMGQLAAEVQFILRRTGPSLSQHPHNPPKHRLPTLIPLSEPEPVKHTLPLKALSFNLGPSTFPRRNKPKRTVSPEPQKVPVTHRDSCSTETSPPSKQHKEEAFRLILQQQQKLHDLEEQIEALERDTELLEQKVTAALLPGPSQSLAAEQEQLEFQLKQYEVELMYEENWEEELKVEAEREQEMQKRLDQIHKSIKDKSYEIEVTKARVAHLEDGLQVAAQKEQQASEEAARLTDEAIRSLTQELHKRLQVGEELDAALADTQWELQTAEETVKDRIEMIHMLHKNLRQSDLQCFMQQSDVTLHPDHISSVPGADGYLNNTHIRK